VLISLIAQSELNNKKADISLAKEVIQRFISNISKEITIENIQALVADFFDISIEQLKSKSRKRNIVIPRQLGMYLAKMMTEQSLKEIGFSFGGRDHSTVIYSCKTIEDLMDTDGSFKTTVD